MVVRGKKEFRKRFEQLLLLFSGRFPKYCLWFPAKQGSTQIMEPLHEESGTDHILHAVRQKDKPKTTNKSNNIPKYVQIDCYSDRGEHAKPD
jgi:hypothetical protein